MGVHGQILNSCSGREDILMHEAVAAAVCLWFSLLCSAQVTPPTTVLTVDSSKILSDVSRRPIGINLNFLTDRPSLFAPSARPLAGALEDLGVHYLRYPGGEKSQSYLWSTPPFESSKPALSRTGPNEFWSSQRVYTRPDGKTLIDPMGFDEFMTLCHSIGCIPDIVVNHNSYLGPKTSPDAAVPTRQQLIDTAAAWVHYSNIVKKYDVHYWEIGNETYMKAYNGPRQEPTAYGHDVHDYAVAMKHEDPTIKLGVSGNTYEYYRDALKVSADDVDFLVVHSYPCCASYEAYQRTPRFDGSVDPARKAIADLTPTQRNHMGMALTEVNALDFLPGRKDANDLGHALLLFEILAQYITYDPDVDFEEVWNTRWIDNNKIGVAPSIFDMLNNRNQLNATGVAMALLDHGLLTKMVEVSIPSGDGMITGYATSNTSGKLNIFIVNRDLHPRNLTLDLRSAQFSGAFHTLVFTGVGPNDLYPIFKAGFLGAFTNGKVSLLLPPVSMTEVSVSR
jgi:alpha-N-arabinofuranosidase